MPGFFGTSLPTNWTNEEVALYDQLFNDAAVRPSEAAADGLDPTALLQSDAWSNAGMGLDATICVGFLGDQGWLFDAFSVRSSFRWRFLVSDGFKRADQKCQFKIKKTFISCNGMHWGCHCGNTLKPFWIWRLFYWYIYIYMPQDMEAARISLKMSWKTGDQTSARGILVLRTAKCEVSVH